MTQQREAEAATSFHNAFIVLSAIGVKTVHAAVESAADASAVWRKFVEDNDLGASDLKPHSGFVFANDRLAAKVLYNGRVWLPESDGMNGQSFEHQREQTMERP